VLEFVQASRNLARWGLPARIAALFTVQAFPWILFYSHGAASAGIFQALCSPAALTNPVVFSTGNLITATIAGGTGRERFERAFRHGLYGLAAIGPYYLVALVVPHTILRVFYGSNSLYVRETVSFKILILGYSLQAVAIMTACAIGGRSETRKLFHLQMVGMVAALVIGLPAAARYGIAAAALGFAIVQCFQALYGLRVCWQLYEQRAGQQKLETT
jgi:hypothetical protein